MFKQVLQPATLATLLLMSSLSITSCSKDQEVTPSSDRVLVTTSDQNVTLTATNAAPGQVTNMTYPTGVSSIALLSSHPELDEGCFIEFWQGSARKLSVRGSRVVYGDDHLTVKGLASVQYTIPAKLEPGSYTIVLRTSSNRSFTIGTYGDPTTYTTTLSTTIEVDNGQYQEDGGLTGSQPSIVDPNEYALNWNSQAFPSTPTVRAFAQDQTTGTLYQLTPDFQLNWNGTVGIPNTGSATIQINDPNAKNQFLPAGLYYIYLDDFGTKVIGAPKLSFMQFGTTK